MLGCLMESFLHEILITREKILSCPPPILKLWPGPPGISRSGGWSRRQRSWAIFGPGIGISTSVIHGALGLEDDEKLYRVVAGAIRQKRTGTDRVMESTDGCFLRGMHFVSIKCRMRLLERARALKLRVNLE
jgi:hypothetical protein